jgi:hypothetical protein
LPVVTCEWRILRAKGHDSAQRKVASELFLFYLSNVVANMSNKRIA